MHGKKVWDLSILEQFLQFLHNFRRRKLW
jgi:hypothetical protein